MKINTSNRMIHSEGHFLANQQEAIKKLNSQGLSILNLGRGNPDLSTFSTVVERMGEAVASPINHGYPPYGGKDSLKKAIISFYKAEYDVDLDLDEVTIFSGSQSVLTALPMVLANPGDVVLSPNPAFFGYATGIRMAGAKNVLMDLVAENQFLPDFNKLSADTLEKAKLMFLNYPNNPTGAGATATFFEKTVHFAKDNNIVVAHDFAYADISFDNQCAPSFLQVEGAKDVGIEIYTLSKTFNMAGWRIAFAVGNREVIQLINQYIRSSVGGTFGAIQDAATFGLLHSQRERAELLDIYEARRNLVVNLLKQNEIPLQVSAGTFFIWVKLPSGIDDVAFTNTLLQEEHVAIVAGTTFGSAGKGYVRISLVSDLNSLEDGVTRFIRFYKSHKE